MKQDYTLNQYNDLNTKLNGSPYSRAIRFLNLGYMPTPEVPRKSRIDLSGVAFSRNNAELVCEIVGETELENEDILDVCCGRGGTTSVLNRYFHPRSVKGIDASSAAIEFCCRYSMAENAEYLIADYRSLPFPDNQFGRVISVEPYYEYPGAELYIREVYRVLKPGGYLLYSNLLPQKEFDFITRWLAESGMVIDRNQEVTRCIMQSSEGADDSGFRNIVGSPGLESFDFGRASSNFDDIASGRRLYRILRAFKPEGRTGK